MKLELREPDIKFTSGSQKAKDITEGWIAETMYCPNCGNSKLNQLGANLPVEDFYCTNCQDRFELKSQKKSFGNKFANGAYHTKIERLNSNRAPNLILMKYSIDELQIKELLVVPKRLFIADVVEKRKPLAPTARRAGWIGSNIVLGNIPKSGLIQMTCH